MFSQELAWKYRKNLHAEFVQQYHDPIYQDSENMTRLTFRNIIPSPRYQQWVKVLEKRQLITPEEADHLIGLQPEAA